jgi:putative nucleotidyltransferase with HDIG domain
MTKRILFVDDDPMVLSGLERSLRSMRKEWEMQFVLGGREALDAMAHAPFDVVISDMRMPGMDGAELLERVKQQFSRTVRMVLSGQSDRDTIFRSTKPTHQYFSKPCDAEELKQKLIRALALRDVLDNPKLMQWVSQVETVPSLPSLCQSLRSLLASPAASIVAVADIVVQDMGMTAKLLQLVNSAFLGVAERGSDPRRAVSVIGIENLRALVSHELFSELPTPLAEKLHGLWRHSRATAALAQAIVRAEGLPESVAQDAFTAGLLHDIGQVVLASTCGEEYDAAIRLASAEHSTLVEGEQGVFGTTHAQVGAYLLGLWGLPDAVVEAVAWHHAPGLARRESFSPLIAVHVANFLDRELHPSRPDASHNAIDLPLLTGLGVAERLPGWKSQCRELEDTKVSQNV